MRAGGGQACAAGIRRRERDASTGRGGARRLGRTASMPPPPRLRYSLPANSAGRPQPRPESRGNRGLTRGRRRRRQVAGGRGGGLEHVGPARAERRNGAVLLGRQPVQHALPAVHTTHPRKLAVPAPPHAPSPTPRPPPPPPPSRSRKPVNHCVLAAGNPAAFRAQRGAQERRTRRDTGRGRRSGSRRSRRAPWTRSA